MIRPWRKLRRLDDNEFSLALGVYLGVTATLAAIGLAYLVGAAL